MCSAETNTLTLKQVLLRDLVYFVSASVVVVVKLVKHTTLLILRTVAGDHYKIGLLNLSIYVKLRRRFRRQSVGNLQEGLFVT